MRIRHMYHMPQVIVLIVFLLLAGCAATPAQPTQPAAPAITATPAGQPPSIGSVTADRNTLGLYERIELSVPLTASYDDPIDSQQIALSASFTAPSGANWEIPGFWDGKNTWRIRFTPSELGSWRYTVRVHDRFGDANSSAGSFAVQASDRHGWVQVASWRDPALSSRYLIYHDGTPFYGVGHCEAFTLGDARFDADGELKTLKRMRAAGENLVVWWPHYDFTFFGNAPTDFDPTDMRLIDSYLASAERLSMTVVYTIWDHNLLRGAGHPWGNGSWDKNGFRRITPNAADFFSSEESWRVQENLYRYLIARWGYSPSIIWMTVSELDGTSAGPQQDAWHAKINEYFVRHDPYRHPTTASLSGDKNWAAGFAVTDIPQVHVYAEQKDAIRMGDSVGDWTARMWQAQPRPNVVGEFGTTNRAIDERLVHNSIWLALTHGAAITPLRWSDTSRWGRTSDKVLAQLGNLGRFVADIPFTKLDLKLAEAHAKGESLTANALATTDYGIVWVQDRTPGEPRSGVTLSVAGFADGSYSVRPFDPWTGTDLAPLTATATAGTLNLTLPEFSQDIALKISKVP